MANINLGERIASIYERVYGSGPPHDSVFSDFSHAIGAPSAIQIVGEHDEIDVRQRFTQGPQADMRDYAPAIHTIAVLDEFQKLGQGRR